MGKRKRRRQPEKAEVNRLELCDLCDEVREIPALPPGTGRGRWLTVPTVLLGGERDNAVPPSKPAGGERRAGRPAANRASPDAENSGPGSRVTPLCTAACWGHTATERELLAHGADPNLREDHGTGWSPLGWANNGPRPDTAEVLRAAGAHPTPKTRPVP